MAVFLCCKFILHLIASGTVVSVCVPHTEVSGLSLETGVSQSHRCRNGCLAPFEAEEEKAGRFALATSPSSGPSSLGKY